MNHYESGLNTQGVLHHFVIEHGDLTETATATAQVIPLISLLAGDAVTRCFTKLETALADASDAAFNDAAITVGDGGDVDRYLASQQLNVNGTEVLLKDGTGTAYMYLVDDTVDLTVNSMTAKALNDIDVGKLHVWIEVEHRSNWMG